MIRPIEILLRILAIIGCGLLKSLTALLVMFAELFNLLAEEIMQPLAAQMRRFNTSLNRATERV